MTGTISKYIQKNRKLSWRYSLRVGKDEAGKWIRITKSGFATKTAAQNASDEVRRDREKAAREHDPRTFADFVQTWLKEHCARHCEPTTVEGYEKKAAYAVRHFGNVQLTKLTGLQIEKALNALSDHGGKVTAEYPKGRPLSAKTIRETAAVVSMVFNCAIRWGVVDFNPMKRVTLPRVTKKEPTVLEVPQLDWLLAGVHDHQWLSLLLELAAATGCRRGELLALAWSDVDLASGALRIERSLAQTKKGLFIKAPKGRKARSFSLPASAVAALQAHQVEQNRSREMFGSDYRSDLNLIFASIDGDYLSPGSVSAKVSLLARKLGFPKGVSLHTLRHTHGSHLLSAGVPLPAVSKRLGHANTHVTATIYSHALDKDDTKAAEAWEKVMAEVRKNDGKRM